MPQRVFPPQLQRVFSVKLTRLFQGHPVLRTEMLLLIAILISIVSGIAAVALEQAIEWMRHFMHTGGIGLHGTWHLVFTVLTPAVGGFVVGLILHYLVPAARGDSIPQVKLDLMLRGGTIPLRVSVGKFVTTVIAIGSGGSIGHEGPTVQICAGLGSVIARWFPMPAAWVRTMVHAASAAGLAGAFRTPIAAMMFVMEEIIGDLDVRRLSYLILAAVGASMVARSVMGSQPLFEVPTYTFQHPAELGLYVLLGVSAGLLSVAFIRLLSWGIARCQALPLPVYIKPVLGGLSVGLMALVTPQILGIGYDSVRHALQNHLPWTLMLALTLAKFFATLLSYSSGTAGGLLAPSLFIGSMLGGGLAGLISVIPGISVYNPGAFALVGMGAVFGGIMRTSLTAILIIFEMTNDYAIILPLMVATMTSYVIANYLEPRNVYEAILEVNRVHLPSHQDYLLLDELTAGEAMVRRPMTVQPDISVSEVAALLERYPYRGFPVVSPERKLLGMVSIIDVRRALRKGLKDKPVISIATTKDLVYARPDHTLNWVMQQMGERDISIVPVVTRGDPPRVLGVLTMSDIVRAFAHNKTQESSLQPAMDESRDAAGR